MSGETKLGQILLSRLVVEVRLSQVMSDLVMLVVEVRVGQVRSY